MVFAKASHLNKPDTKDKDKYKLTGMSITSCMAKYNANVTGIYK